MVAQQHGAGPHWADPQLNELASGLRAAHQVVAVLPPKERLRLSRQLLTITDLAKRDTELAVRRLRVFLRVIDNTTSGRQALS
jgi:hypothetical protein